MKIGSTIPINQQLISKSPPPGVFGRLNVHFQPDTTVNTLFLTRGVITGGTQVGILVVGDGENFGVMGGPMVVSGALQMKRLHTVAQKGGKAHRTGTYVRNVHWRQGQLTNNGITFFDWTTIPTGSQYVNYVGTPTAVATITSTQFPTKEFWEEDFININVLDPPP